MITAIYIIGGILLAFFLYTGFRRYQQMKNYDPASESQHLLQLTDANFNKNTAKGLVLVDFWAPWCTPCKIIAPTVSELAEEYAGKIKVGKLNVDENQQVAGKLGIRSIPTLILFQDGKPVEQFVGVKPKSAFQKAINSRLA